jgi:threonine aldolase
MNDRQQAHINYYLERLAYWETTRHADIPARMLAARDADDAYPLRTEDEAAEVFAYLNRLEREKRGAITL